MGGGKGGGGGWKMIRKDGEMFWNLDRAERDGVG